jgi:hypothetical protein
MAMNSTGLILGSIAGARMSKNFDGLKAGMWALMEARRKHGCGANTKAFCRASKVAALPARRVRSVAGSRVKSAELPQTVMIANQRLRRKLIRTDRAASVCCCSLFCSGFDPHHWLGSFSWPCSRARWKAHRLQLSSPIRPQHRVLLSDALSLWAGH